MGQYLKEEKNKAIVDAQLINWPHEEHQWLSNSKFSS